MLLQSDDGCTLILMFANITVSSTKVAKLMIMKQQMYYKKILQK